MKGVNESIKVFLDNSLGKEENLYEIHIYDESLINKIFQIKQNEIVKEDMISKLRENYQDLLGECIDYHILDNYEYDVINDNYAILDNGIDELMLIKLEEDKLVTLKSGSMKDIMKAFGENLLEDKKRINKKEINLSRWKYKKVKDRNNDKNYFNS